MGAVRAVADDRSEWIRCKPWIEAALEHCRGTHTMQDIEDGIEDGTYRFFSSPNSAVVARLIDYPQKKALNYFLVGGNLEELKTHVEPYVTAWAKQQGVTIVTLVGRDGWIRTLAPLGFVKGWSLAYKEI
jgi:hypothetical protein